MSTVKNTISGSPESSPIDFINQSLEAAALKPGPRLLLARIVSWSGKKGRCWYSVETMASRLSVSVRTIQRWKKDLLQSGFLAEILSPYRTPYLIPYPDGLSIPAAKTDTSGVTALSPSLLKKERIEERCTVPNHGTLTEASPPYPEWNDNAVKICSEDLSLVTETTSFTPPIEPIPELVSVLQAPSQPESIQHKPVPSTVLLKPKLPLTQDHLFLVEEIERVTGDTWSRGHFINLVRQTDEQTIYSALSVTKEKISLESGVNAGAYLTATVKGLTYLKNLGPSTPPFSVSPMRPLEPKRQLAQQPKPIEIPEPEPEPLDIELMKKGWLLLYRPGNVGSVLSVIGRCLEGWDVSATWKSLLSERQGEPEEAVLHELLDLAALKVEYAIDAGR